MTEDTAKRSLLVLFVLIAIALTAGCSGPGPDSQLTAKSETVETAESQAGKNAKTADLPPERPSVVRGKEIYLRSCASCHGASGRGDGESAAYLDPKPDDFTDTAFLGRHSPRAFFDVVATGKDGMPSYKQGLSNQDRWDVVFYTMTMANNPERIAQAAEIYRKNCSGCHGGAGKGDGEVGAVLKVKPTDFTDMDRMLTKKSEGLFASATKGEESMPSFQGALADEDIRDTVDYLWTFVYEQ